jgi:hypothetical protein
MRLDGDKQVMHATPHDQAQGAMFSAVDAAEMEERKRKREAAKPIREAAYAKLDLSENERATLEWACAKRLNEQYSELRPFFDEAESLSGDEQVSAWLEGPMFRDNAADKLRAAARNAAVHYDKYQASVRFADRAESGVLWVLRIAAGGVLAFSVFHAIVRLSAGS